MLDEISMIHTRTTVFLQLCTVVSCHILRLKCKQEADFAIKYKDKKLPGPPFATYDGISVQHCYAHCLRENRCKSVNINNAGVISECELIGKSASDTRDDIVPSFAAGWHSHTTNFSSRLIGTKCKKYGVSKCQSHQTCIDSCECPGYKCVDCFVASKLGYHCNVCVNNPCGENGLCIEDGDSFKCHCNSGFNGPLCKNALVDPCNSNPCINGVCIAMGPTYRCTCNDGYAGINCEMPHED